MKVATTNELFKMNQVAEERGYNRVLNETALDSIDPEGIHICVDNMIHEYAQGTKVQPHVRSFWYCKMRGQENPQEVFIDTDLELFNTLRSVQEFKDQQGIVE